MPNLKRCITSDGAAVCVLINSTDIAARAERIHRTSAVVTAALGRLLTVASMMGAMLKEKDHSVTLRVKGDGPAGVVIAVAQGDGSVKGYVENPIVEIPLNSLGKLDVSGAVGKNGTLHVMKDVGEEEPVSGFIELVSGEIAEDITSYYAASEQIPTVCALGVLVNPNLTVRAAGGFLLQLLPYAPEDTITKIEANLKGIEPISTMIDKKMTHGQIMDKLFAGFEYNELDELDAVYRCDCSRQRAERAVLSLGKEEAAVVLREKGLVEVHCHFCNKNYRFNEAELGKLFG